MKVRTPIEILEDKLSTKDIRVFIDIAKNDGFQLSFQTGRHIKHTRSDDDYFEEGFDRYHNFLPPNDNWHSSAFLSLHEYPGCCGIWIPNHFSTYLPRYTKSTMFATLVEAAKIVIKTEENAGQLQYTIKESQELEKGLLPELGFKRIFYCKNPRHNTKLLTFAFDLSTYKLKK